MKTKTIKVKGWAVVHREDGDDMLVGGSFIPQIYPEDCKDFATSFAKVRNRKNRYSHTKVVPCLISFQVPTITSKKGKR